VLGVDVVLELTDPARLEPHAVHLVARVLLVRIEGAEHLVVDQQVHEDPLAAAPGALDPPVVGLLVGERVVVRPVLQRRPAARVVGADGVAVGDRVLADGAEAVGLVVRAVDQRARRPVRMPRTAAVDPAAEELEGHHVHVGVEEAGDLAERGGAPRGLADGVDVGLGVDGATVGRLEREAGGVAGLAQQERPAVAGGQDAVPRRERDRERAAARVVDAPVGLLARRRGALDPLAAADGQRRELRHDALLPEREEVAAAAIEQVAAERGGLHAEALGAGRSGGRRAVAAVAGLDDVAVELHRLQRVAAVREPVGVAALRGDRRGNDEQHRGDGEARRGP
jgi:hypothetical protein